MQLAWLINPQQQQVEIYRQGRDVEIFALAAKLSGEDILPGFNPEFTALLRVVVD